MFFSIKCLVSLKQHESRCDPELFFFSAQIYQKAVALISQDNVHIGWCVKNFSNHFIHSEYVHTNLTHSSVPKTAALSFSYKHSNNSNL
jgi:hypothetical protein